MWASCPDHCMAASRRGYLRDDGCAVVLGPEGGGRTLVGSGAASVAPATFCHPRWYQTRSTAGQLTTARANQRNLRNLGGREWAYCNDCLFQEETKNVWLQNTLFNFLCWLCSAVVNFFVFPSPPCFLWPIARLPLSGPRPAVLHWQRQASSPGECWREERQIGRKAPERQRTPCCNRLNRLLSSQYHYLRL